MNNRLMRLPFMALVLAALACSPLGNPARHAGNLRQIATVAVAARNFDDLVKQPVFELRRIEPEILKALVLDLEIILGSLAARIVDMGDLDAGLG